MAEAKHTSIPWGIHPLDDSRVVVGGRGALTCQIPVASCDRKEDAEFIVRVANSHAELLVACEAALKRWDREGCIYNDQDEALAIRAAVKKARGG